MNTKVANTVVGLVAAVVLGGCSAAPTYSPPPERRMADRCPVNEVWVCTDHSPSRLGRANDDSATCRCERPEFIR